MKASRPPLGPTHPHIHWTPGAISPGIEYPSSAKVKIYWGVRHVKTFIVQGKLTVFRVRKFSGLEP